jgi:hypothetical protein
MRRIFFLLVGFVLSLLAFPLSTLAAPGSGCR